MDLYMEEDHARLQLAYYVSKLRIVNAEIDKIRNKLLFVRRTIMAVKAHLSRDPMKLMFVGRKDHVRINLMKRDLILIEDDIVNYLKLKKFLQEKIIELQI